MRRNRYPLYFFLIIIIYVISTTKMLGVGDGTDNKTV